jgi:DNA-directed RNA polymerase subunit E'/Rpb7
MIGITSLLASSSGRVGLDTGPNRCSYASSTEHVTMKVLFEKGDSIRFKIQDNKTREERKREKKKIRENNNYDLLSHITSYSPTRNTSKS